MHPLEVAVLLCTLLYRGQWYSVFLSSPGNKHKSNSDVAGGTVLFKAYYYTIKNVFYFFVFVFYVLFV